MCTRKDTKTRNVCKVLHFLEPLARNIDVSATRGQGSWTWPYDTWNLSLTNNSALIAESPLLYFYYQCITCKKKTNLILQQNQVGNLWRPWQHGK